MQHFSQERLDWIDGRLFTLARTAMQLRGNGLRLINGHQMAPDAQSAAQLLNAALTNVNAERLALMAERAAINEYNQDQSRG